MFTLIDKTREAELMTNISNINRFMAISELYFRLTENSPLTEPTRELIDFIEAVNDNLVPVFSLIQYINAQESKLDFKQQLNSLYSLAISYDQMRVSWLKAYPELSPISWHYHQLLILQVALFPVPLSFHVTE